MHENQRVVWVVVLVLVCFSFGFVGPVQDFFMAPATNPTRARVYGRKVTEGDLDSLGTRLALLYRVFLRAGGVLPELGINRPLLPLPGLLDDAFEIAAGGASEEFFAFREKALREGFRVSDRELGEHVRFLWERVEALSAAHTEMNARREKAREDPSAPEPSGMDFFSILEKKLREVGTKPFDAKSWAGTLEKLSGGRRLGMSRAEETLRDVLLLSKLFRFVKGSVNVAPQEAFEEFLEQRQRRKLTWAEFPVTRELEEAVAKTVTDEDVALEYEADAKKYGLGDTVKARWLLVPKKHFVGEVSGKLTEEDLQDYYRRYKNLFRKPAVSSLEASFYPLSPEEKAALDRKLFFSLEEVREQVRERAIDEKGTIAMREFARELVRRLYPPQRPGETPQRPATFAELLKEYPFLESKVVDFVEESAAREQFGPGYTRQVETWFRTIAKYRQDAARGSATSPPRIEAPRTYLEGEDGLVFYSEVQHRGPRIPLLREIAERVRRDAVLRKSLKALRSALEESAGKIDRGETTFEEETKGPLEVALEPRAGESERAKVSIAPARIESSLEPVERRGSVKVARPKGAAEEGKGEPEEGEKPGEAVHEASDAISAAGFGPAAAAKTAVGTSEKTKAAYLVRVDEIIPPEREAFAKERGRFESDLLLRRRNAHLAEWMKSVRAEAGLAVLPAAGRPTEGDAS